MQKVRALKQSKIAKDGPKSAFHLVSIWDSALVIDILNSRSSAQ